MSESLQKIGNLKDFAALQHTKVEEDFAAILRGEQTAGFNMLDHLAETVFKRLRKLVDVVSRSFHSREREVETVAAGFISGVPVLLLGPPGTAKSMVVRKIAFHCGLAPGEDKQNEANTKQSKKAERPSEDKSTKTSTEPKSHGGYFEYLLTNHTMPEELFGGPDLEELAKGKIKKVTTGKLPRAEIAFLDEVFRGGGHILNTLLTIINEKRFDSGDGSEHVPLLGLVGASNDIPREQDLDAFFDRFPVRAWVQSVLESRQRAGVPNTGGNSAAQLINLSVDAEKNRLTEAWNSSAATKDRIEKRESCTNDFRFARMLLLHRLGGAVDKSARFAEFERLFRAVRDRARLSDRAFGQLWLFAAALDLLRNRDPIQGYRTSQGHLDVFRYVGRSPQDAGWLNDVVTQHMQGMQHNGVA